MNAMEAILTRRSIRKYITPPKDIPKEVFRELLRAGMHAPSAKNAQPWQFIVITEKSILEAIPKFHPYASMLKNASAAIVVLADLRLAHEEFWKQDLGAVTQNILLAAKALGLGAVWLGTYPVRERVEGLRKLLNVPEEVTPYSIVSLGYPAEEPKAANRFKEDRIHWEKW